MLGAWLRDVTRLNPHELPHLRPGRAREQPAAGHPRGHRPRTGRPRSASSTSASTATAGSSRCCPSTCARACSRATCSPAGTALFTCYEAFIHIVDSMFNQHAKWLEASLPASPWRRPIPSLNYLLSSHVWRQDHNGFTHQDPGFLDVVMNKKPEHRAGLPAAGRQHAAVHVRPLPALPAVRQRRRRRQAAAGRLAVRRGGRPALRAGPRDLGLGGHRGAGRRRCRTSCSPAPATIPTLETLAAASILRDASSRT